jgi:fatty acid desaturase
MMSSSSGVMVEHPADRRSVVTGVAIVALGVVPYVLRPASAWGLAWAPIASVLSLSAWSIVHNQIHHRIFRRERDGLNTAWSLFISLATGHPPTGLVETHNYNHHVHIGAAADWSRPENAGQGWGVVRCLRYAVITARNMARGRRGPDARPLSPRLKRRLRAEKLFLYPAAIAALALAPRIFLCFTLPTWIGGTILFLGVNLLQHDGCEPASEVDHSRDFTSPLMNWFFFGGGFHTAHHLRPGLHWSELAASHARVVAPRRRRADLSERSILAFFARAYLVPRPSPGARHEPAES